MQKKYDLNIDMKCLLIRRNPVKEVQLVLIHNFSMNGKKLLVEERKGLFTIFFYYFPLKEMDTTKPNINLPTFMGHFVSSKLLSRFLPIYIVL